MSETETKQHEGSPDEIRAKALREFQEAADLREAKRAANTISDMTQALLGEKEATPEQENVRDVLETVHKRAAGAAARTQPAGMVNARYRSLPKWQQEVRSADGDYQAARFLVALRDKDTATLREIRAEDKKARAVLLEGLPATNDGPFDGSGGELLPLPLSNLLDTALYRGARMRRVARVVPAGAGASMRFAQQTELSNNEWLGENAVPVAADQEPEYASHVQLVLKSLRNMSHVGNELLQDSPFAVGNYLINDVGEHMAATEDEAIYSNGDGTDTQPQGLEASQTSVGTAPANQIPMSGGLQAANFALADTLVYQDLVALFFALPEKARRQAIFSGGDQVAQVLTNLLDMNGRPILRLANSEGGIVSDAEAGGATGTIFGRPFWNLPGAEAADPAAPTNGTNRLYFSAMMRTVVILEKGGIQVAASTDSGEAFDRNETKFRFIRRVDSAPIGNDGSRLAGDHLDFAFIGQIIASS